MLIDKGPDCFVKPKEPGLFDEWQPPEDAPIGSGVRTLRENQYGGSEVPSGQVVRGTEEMRGLVGDALRADGNHSEPLAGLFSFVRSGGGAGFQGVTKEPLDHITTVVRNFHESRGEVVAAVDLSRIDPACVYDFGSPSLRAEFLGRYAKFEKMYNRLAQEGVVAVRGDIRVENLTGLMRVPKNVSAAAMQEHLRTLLGGK